MSTRYVSGIDAAIHLKSEFLQVLGTGTTSEWRDHLLRFIEALAALTQEAPAAVPAILAELQSEISLATAGDVGSCVPAKSAHCQGSDGFSTGVPWQTGAVPSDIQLSPPSVRAISEFIDEHYAEPVTLSALSSALGRSKRHLAALFRKQTGGTIHAYLTYVRMRHACALILRGEKIEAVSLLVGYRSKKNFYRHFKQVIGGTPLDYRRRRP